MFYDSLGWDRWLRDALIGDRFGWRLTFAGVGLNTDIRQIARTGWRPLLVAVIGLTVVASVSLGIVLLTSRVFHWGAGA